MIMNWKWRGEIGAEHINRMNKKDKTNTNKKQTVWRDDIALYKHSVKSALNVSVAL